MKKRYSWHIVLLLYIAFVFSNSLTPAVVSAEKSGFALQLAHEILGMVGISARWLTEHVIRKSAHFTEYAVMGILLYQCMRYSSCNENLKGRIHMAAIFFIPFVDETLQLFTEGRSGQISDVWLDISGVLCGTLLCITFLKVWDRYKNKNKK
ncbi:MAG: VanZ family protein [Clostridium sp.]